MIIIAIIIIIIMMKIIREIFILYKPIQYYSTIINMGPV